MAGTLPVNVSVAAPTSYCRDADTGRLVPGSLLGHNTSLHSVVPLSTSRDYGAELNGVGIVIDWRHSRLGCSSSALVSWGGQLRGGDHLVGTISYGVVKVRPVSLTLSVGTCTAPPKRDTNASKPPTGADRGELSRIAHRDDLGPGGPRRLPERTREASSAMAASSRTATWRGVMRR